MKNTILLSALALFFFACSSTENEHTEAVTKPDIKIYVFTVGDILAKDVSLFSPGIDEGQEKHLTNSAYLIRHPKGDLMWDTGLPDALAAIEDGDDSEHFLMKMPKTLQSQLDEIDVKPADIDYLAVSHIHGDHIGNMGLFTASKLLMQEEDYEGLFGSEEPNPAVEGISANEAVKLNGDYDVFGDGRVVIKRAVGHTAGHQVLYVELPKTGKVLLSGDLYHFTKNREQRGVPAFNFDKELSLASMDAIEAFLDSTKTTLWIQHDIEENAKIPHSPEFIQ